MTESNLIAEETTQRQYELATRLTNDLETPPLPELVHDSITTDSQLVHLLEAAARIEHVHRQRTEIDGPDLVGSQQLARAEKLLMGVAETRAEECTARVCRTVIDHSDTWIADGRLSEEHAAAVTYTAREWLQLHIDLTSRLGLLEEDSTDA